MNPIEELVFSPTKPEDAAGVAPGGVSPSSSNPVEDLVFRPQQQRSAQEIVQRGQFAGRDWKDTAEALKKAGYHAPDEYGVQYEQHRALKAEAEKQGAGVGFLEQIGRHEIPFKDWFVKGDDAQAHEAMQRFEAGKATPDDIKTIATVQRRQQADRSIRETAGDTGYGVLNAMMAAPKIVGEQYAGGKILGLGGKALGIGKNATVPYQAAIAPTRTRAVMNFAGKQALLTPMMPSLYMERAEQKNLEEKRDPHDVRGFAPALGLAYVNNLVLGSLQKYGNTGSFPRQIAQKGVIGVGEQAIADTGLGLADEFLPKAYKTDTKYGVVGDLARGKGGKALSDASVQMFTFGYFAALHGKQPAKLADSFSAALAEPGGHKAVEEVHKAANDALAKNPDLTSAEAKAEFDKALKDLSEAGREYADQLAKTLPEKPSIRDELPKPDAKAEADAAALEEADRKAFEKSRQVSEPKPEPPVMEKPKTPIEMMHPEDRKAMAESLGLSERGLKDYLKDPKKNAAANLLAESFNKAREPKAPTIAPAEGTNPAAPEPTQVSEPKPEPAAQENRRPELSLATGERSGERDHQGNELTVHAITDATGNKVGEMKLFQSGGTLHVHWVGATGLGGGEGRGNNPFGPREIMRLLPEVAKAYPDAVVMKYTPAAGRINAGDTKWIDLEKVRQKGEVADRRSEQTEGHPGRRASDQPGRTFEAEKVAPDAIAPEKPLTIAKPTAEHRPFPYKARLDVETQVTPGELESDARVIAEHAYAGEPHPQDRLRLASLINRLRAAGIKDYAKQEVKAENTHRKYGLDAFNDHLALIEEVLKKAEARKRLRAGLAEVKPELDDEESSAMADALDARSKSYKEWLANERRKFDERKVDSGITENEQSRASRSLQLDAYRALEDGIQDGRSVANDAVASGEAPEGAEPKESGPAKSEGVATRKAARLRFTRADAEYQKAVKDSQADYDAYNKGNKNQDDKAFRELNSKLDQWDKILLPLIEKRKAALAELAKLNGHKYTVYHVDAAGGKPRAVASFDDLASAQNESEKLAFKTARGRPDSFGRDIKNELGEKGTYHEYQLPPSGKIYIEVTPHPDAPKKASKPERIKTVVDDVIDKGGIRWDSAMEAHFGTQGEARQYKLDRPGLFTKDSRAHSLDTMAEALGMTPGELVESLKKGEKAPSRLHDNTNAYEFELQQHMKEQEEEALDRGETGGEWKPSGEDIPYSREPGTELLGGRVSETKPEGGGAFDIIARQNKLFDVRNYVEKATLYDKDALAVALKERNATVTSKLAAGDPLVNLEEHAHHLQKALGLPESPDGLPLEVARGAQRFYKPDGPGAPTKMGMIEGFAKWMRERATDQLIDLHPEEKAASDYFEKFLADKGVTPKLDAIRDLYRKYTAKPATEQAAGNVSATGKPVEADRTAKEIATDFTQKAKELVDDNLAVLGRVIDKAKSLGHKIGNDVYNAYSQLMHAAPHFVAQFEKDGVHGYDAEGRKVVMGQSWAKITEGAKKEWLTPAEGGSKAGVYAVARHVLGEESRGRNELVSPVQLEQYRRAMAEFQKDKEFIAWADPFAERLTKAFNATRRALASDGVHFLSKEEVEAWEKKYPDYVPTERVMQDAGWRAQKGSKGELLGAVTGERSGSGEQIIDPLITYKNRLAQTASRMTEQLKRNAAHEVLKLPGMGEWAVPGEKTLSELGKRRAEKLKEIGFKGEELNRMLEDMGSARDEEYFTTKPWPTDGTKPTWGVMGPDGKLISYRIGNRDLYNLLTGQQVDANAAASWLRATGNFLPVKLMTDVVKFGATSASLGFQFRNVPRDIYTFWANTTDRMKANPRDLGDAYKRAFAFAWNQLTQHFGSGKSTDALFNRFAADRGEGLRKFDFDRDNPASAYEPNRSKPIETAYTVWGVLKDTLRVAGAGELAPRFLEWKTRLQQTTGKSEAELTKLLADAEKAQADGKPVPDPIPLSVALDAMNAAAEVTVNFNRLGTLTREMNKITPFFGPSIAGLSKSIRNWRDNPKGAAFAMAGLLGARLIHWLLYSDEDWYKELNSNDRYNNFVVPTPAGLRRFPAPRDLEVAGGGFLITALDAAAGKNPDLKGYLKESLGAVSPPFPAPPVAKTGYQIATNENWMGSPIVPKRDENTSTLDKWTEHRAGYAADQLTGGLVSDRKIPKEAKDLIPYTEVRNARRSVDEFYDRFKELEEERAKVTRGGLRYENEAEYQRLEKAQQQIVKLSRAIRGERLVNGKVVKGDEPSAEEKAKLRQEQIEIARRIMQK